MNEFEKMKHELDRSGKRAQLDALAKSSEAARLKETVDSEALKKAASRGDSETLSRMLQQVLATEDGKALLKKINENFGK